jgi:hypothetical protein
MMFVKAFRDGSIDFLLPPPGADQGRFQQEFAGFLGVIDNILELPPDFRPFCGIGFPVPAEISSRQTLYLLQGDGPPSP